MKYDVLEPFQKYLYEKLTENTAKTYYGAVKKLFEGCQFDDIREIPMGYVECELPQRFYTKNEYSSAKNGLKYLKEFCPELSLPTEEVFRNQSLHKRNFSKKPKKVIYLHPTQRKINQIKDEKLKIAYRLAMISGLRVSELADLEDKDISFREGLIYVDVRKGKGGHGGIVRCQEDPYLYNRLSAYIQAHSDGKLFYGTQWMKQQAARLGFECHDLRRVFAIRSRKELKAQMSAAQADMEVQKNMRHARFSTTKRYLYNRKLKMEYEYQGPIERESPN